MAIVQPGRRLLQDVKLAFVKSGWGGARRPVNAALSLTSMIDFLVVMVVFLLMTFGQQAPCEGATVPPAENTLDLVDAPLVAVLASGSVLLDGAPAGDTRSVETSHRLERIDALALALRAKRELWRQLHPDRSFPGVVLLEMDAREPALVLKSVFQTAAQAGYPNVSFVVRALPRHH
jgi:hypothetical protein